MTHEDHLPPHLRGPTTTITRIAAGMSGASVYRVDAAGQSFVLKVDVMSESGAAWRSAIDIQRLAADAGLAPRLVHVDELRRAVVTAFVADRSFVAFYADLRTHEAALGQLGLTVRRIHALPLPADAPRRDPRELLALVSGGSVADLSLADFALPGFARDAIQRVLADESPADGRALVLGHNDLNPTNLVLDGEAILVLDWATAGPADALYDLAVLSVFLRMADGACLRLLSAYEGREIVELQDRFLSTRRLAAALAGAFQLAVARRMKHPGTTGLETLDATLSLGDFYQRMRAGTVTIGTADGQWAFGLALLKASLSV